MITRVCFGLLAYLALYVAEVALGYRRKCRRLEEQVRRMGGDPEEDYP
jgi:hypothetical protein